MPKRKEYTFLCAFLESSVLLRPLNFLRIKHDFSRRYNVIYPLLLACVCTSVAFFMADGFSLFGEKGIISNLLKLLTIICPFFIAALASVSTFKNDKLDLLMKGDIIPFIYLAKPPSPDFQYTELTTRRFLSMLFGFCALSSLFLFLLGVIGISFSTQIKGLIPVDLIEYYKLAFVFFFSFAFSQLLLITVIGLYYLGDKIHRL